MRKNNRGDDELRSVAFRRHFTKHAEGSVLACFGDTQVLCTASISDSVPRFIKGTGRGWVTAEYGLLPRSTHTRVDREAARGKQSGRTQEIQRLIGRSLRAMVDLKRLGEMSITIDCDVLQADGGTRTAAISGGCVALIDALNQRQAGREWHPAIKSHVAAISVGMVAGEPLLDLDYQEDSNADTDMNVVMTCAGEFIEVQGTAEHAPFHREALDAMLSLASNGIQTLVQRQRAALE